MKPIFQIAKCVAGPNTDDWQSRPWFITETNFTSDGPRTRICEGRWATEQEARDALLEKKKDMGLV